MSKTGKAPIIGCILAGGLARRMGGGDKPMLSLEGRPLLDHVIARLRPQVDTMILNANGDPARFADFGLSVAADPIDGFAGPLAGVLAGLRWTAEHHEDAEGIVSVAGDTPFFPDNLVARLLEARDGNPDRIVLARCGGHNHPVFGYWPLACADALETFLKTGTTRKVLAFVDDHANARAEFEGSDHDPFFNINTPDDLARASALAREGAS